ncbi:hypothetical protein AWB90_21140 [Mycobacterium paraense]|uniref:Uncharacterized protein n=1 Tax=Mycobacterium paraense TaxID=767916 RepID=A0A1X2A6I5_9MYCO|nr:hypothetical protein [Mycobacterium paraense]ORW41777.1 hypothetical protein AWB90_21140 [Mycobacterium paraense]
MDHRSGRLRWRAKALAVALMASLAATGAFAWKSGAEPSDPPTNDQLIRPLPPIVARPTNWAPKFPFPYDQTRNQVTPADILAEAEMCQWFTAQYQIINDQIERVQFNRIGPNGSDWDYGANGVKQQVDVVTANIDQSVGFLAPRAQALTQRQDFAGDNYFPLYQGQAFYGLWQELSNVSNGIKARQPDWFTGPSYLRVKRLASEIHRSHVCD